MAVSPTRALLTAHLQATWNQSARELGRQGLWVLVLLVGLLGVLAAGPLIFGLGSLGWVLGHNLERPVMVAVLGGFLAVVSLGGGLLGGILGSARQMSWETTRGFPLRLWALFLAELVAGLGDLWPLTFALAAGAFLVGLALAVPAVLPLVPLLWLEGVFLLLTVQLLVGGLASALVKRLRVALLLVGVLAWGLSVLFTGRLPHQGRGGSGRPLSQVQTVRLRALGARFARVAAVLPSHAQALSVARARDHRWGAALVQHGYPLALLLLLMVAGARLLAREASGAARPAPPRSAERLWSFRTPALGVARLHFQTLMGSHLGKFAFVMPLMTLVLLKGPFARVQEQSLWTVPAAFAYLSLVANNFVLNQFGLDRHGIKILLLLPVPPRDLLVGKLLGMAAHQGLQALLMVALLVLFNHPPVAQLVAGLLLMGCFFLAQTALGQWTSAWMPRPMAMDSLKNNTMPFALGMLSLAVSAVWTLLFGGAFALLAWLAPAALVPGMALLFGLLLLAHRALLPAASTFLHARREKLVEALG